MKKLKTLAIMEGVDFYIFAMILISIAAAFPNILKPNTTFLIILIIFLIIGAISMWGGYIYCIVHASQNKDFSPKQRISKLLLIVFLSIFYIPIYYTKYVIKEKKWWGILNVILYIICILSSFVLLAISSITTNEAPSNPIAKKTTVISSDNLVSIDLNENYTCESINLGAYELKCNHNYNDEMIGILNFDYNSFDTYELLNYYTDNYINNYKEIGYSLTNKINSDKLSITTMSRDSSTDYIIIEIKELNNTIKSVLVYLGSDKEIYKDVFPSIKYISN